MVNNTIPVLCMPCKLNICSALQDRMQLLESYSTSERNDAIDSCLSGISQLTSEVKDASSYLPAYDQRTYSDVSFILALRPPLSPTNPLKTRRSRLSQKSFKRSGNHWLLAKSSPSSPASRKRTHLPSAYPMQQNWQPNNDFPHPAATSPRPSRPLTQHL